MNPLETGLTTDGRNISWFKQGEIRCYRGLGGLRRLTQEFLPQSFESPYGSVYGDHVLEFKLAGLPVIGKGMGRYYGLDTDGLNAYMRALGGLFPVTRGEELPDTLRVQLVDQIFVYFPTVVLLEKFGVQRRREEIR